MSEQANANQKVVLSLGDLQQILNYLGTRPYSEVFNVIETVKKARSLESVVAEQEAKVEEASTQAIEA